MKKNQKQTETIKLIVFVFIIAIMGVVILNNCIRYTNYYTVSNIDEKVYKETVKNWINNGTDGIYQNIAENKPISFLAIQRLLDANYVYTRLLNLIIVLAITLLIFKISRNPFSLLYPFILIFLNSMWLTVEIFEALFILLAIHYNKYSGIFTGLAVIFRPYSIIYSILLNKTQLRAFTLIVMAFMGIMLYQGVLFEYAYRLFEYGTSPNTLSETTGIYLLFPFLILAIGGNKTILKYGILACFPLLLRTWAHYLIPAYTFFFLSYMMQLDMKNYITKIKQYLYKGNKPHEL